MLGPDPDVLSSTRGGRDEAFLTGTFGAQTPVAMIDGRQIGTGDMGPVTKKLRGLYKDLIAKECV